MINRGSATIEMTLLIPVIMGVIYLYISLFLFFLDSSNTTKCMAEILYETSQSEENGLQVIVQGQKRSVSVEKKKGIFFLDVELHRNEDIAMKNIRGWQLAADTICAGGDE